MFFPAATSVAVVAAVCGPMQWNEKVEARPSGSSHAAVAEAYQKQNPHRAPRSSGWTAPSQAPVTEQPAEQPTAPTTPEPASDPSTSREQRPEPAQSASAPETTTSTPATSTGAQGTGATGYGEFDYVEEFDTPVARGSWPGDGSGPDAYPQYLSYVDGTSGKYFPSKVLSVQDGVLDWYCHQSMAAAVLPFGYEGFQYGTYTVRMRTDNFEQYHIAFLLWPKTNQWTHELDGPEGETTDTHPYPAVLQSGPENPSFDPDGKKKVPLSWNDAEFHDYTWQWDANEVRFYQDGVLVSTAHGNIPNEVMRPVLQVEWSNRLGGGKPDPSITGHVSVDTVMYDKDPNIAVPVL